MFLTGIYNHFNLFWRTDIFEQLDIQPPKTWDDFYDVLSVIQKNNMTVGIPNVQGTQMSTNNSIFAMLLYKRGGQYYTEARDATAFDREAALDAFRQWTDLYKNYSLYPHVHQKLYDGHHAAGRGTGNRRSLGNGAPAGHNAVGRHRVQYRYRGRHEHHHAPQRQRQGGGLAADKMALQRGGSGGRRH